MKHLHIPSLEKGYQESDIMLIHSIFSVLQEFVDKQHGGIEKYKEHNAWQRAQTGEYDDGCQAWADAGEALEKVYEWWQERKLSDDVPFDPEYSDYLGTFEFVDAEQGKPKLKAVRFKDQDDPDRPRRWSEEHQAKEKAFEEKDTEMMHTVIRYRGFMWT